MNLICPDCGKQYESGKFCLECGAKLQEVAPELVCPSCGYKTKTGKFCPECGAKLAEQSGATTAVLEEPATENTLEGIGEFSSLILKYPGDNLLSVVKYVKDKFGLGLKEAKDLVESRPCVLLHFAPNEQAESMRLDLDSLGCEVLVGDSVCIDNALQNL